MTEQTFAISVEQIQQVHAALNAIGRHLKKLHKKGGQDNQATVALIGSNLMAIQMSLTNLPKASSN